MSLAGILGAGRSTQAISLSEPVTEDTSRTVEIDSVFKVSAAGSGKNGRTIAGKVLAILGAKL